MLYQCLSSVLNPFVPTSRVSLDHILNEDFSICLPLLHQLPLFPAVPAIKPDFPLSISFLFSWQYQL